MRFLIKLALSLLIDLVLTVLVVMIFRGDARWCAAFFVLMSWPLILMVMVVMGIKNDRPVDMIKMENYYNTAAIRRNTERK